MSFIVKLILICQIKDKFIPQIIPIIWYLSIFIFVFILILLIEIFFYYFNNFFIISFNKKKYILLNYLW